MHTFTILSEKQRVTKGIFETILKYPHANMLMFMHDTFQITNTEELHQT